MRETDDKRARMLGERVVAGLSTFSADHRCRALKAIGDAYCSGCEHELIGCTCASFVEKLEGAR